MFTRIKTLFTAPATAPDGAHHRRLGDACAEQDQLPEAAGHYRRALALDARDLPACIGLAWTLCRQQQHEPARQYLRQALAIDPDCADAHHLLGGLAQSTGDLDGAVSHFRQAIRCQPTHRFAHRGLLEALLSGGQLAPAGEAVALALAGCGDSAEFLCLQGHLQAQQGTDDAAIVSYQRALAVQPDAVEPHLPLAQALSRRGLDAPALAHYQQAACHQPADASVQLALGQTLERLGRRAEAIACYCQAVTLDPGLGLAHYHLGNARLNQGDAPGALASFETVLRLDPGNSISHLVAALSGQSTDHPPPDYVRRLFDEYAERFDQHLVQVLHYRTPQELALALLRQRASDTPAWDLLDLGCGTGLLGVALAAVTRRRVGVDLSAPMLDKARSLQLYDRLEHMDLLQMMQQEAAAQYDLVASTDVFIYVGRLDAVVAQAQRLLRPGGWFAFSVESLDALPETTQAERTQGFRLNPTGRYAHARHDLEALADAHGFEVLGVEETTCRVEQGRGVAGYLMLWRRMQPPKTIRPARAG